MYQEFKMVLLLSLDVLGLFTALGVVEVVNADYQMYEQ